MHQPNISKCHGSSTSVCGIKSRSSMGLYHYMFMLQELTQIIYWYLSTRLCEKQKQFLKLYFKKERKEKNPLFSQTYRTC